jgi:hypothetical protein
VPESIRSGAAVDVLAAEEAHGTACTLTLERLRQQYGKALCQAIMVFYKKKDISPTFWFIFEITDDRFAEKNTFECL